MCLTVDNPMLDESSAAVVLADERPTCSGREL